MTSTLRFILCTTALAWQLTACGPGSAGTGTGAPPLSVLTTFGASSSSVCSAPFATQLGCATTATTPTAPDQLPGSALTTYADAARSGHLAVVFEANAVRVESRCPRLRFIGEWGITATQDARFFGTYTVDGSEAVVVAALAVVTTPVLNQLTVVLRDADGRIVLGPTDVVKDASPATVPVLCP